MVKMILASDINPVESVTSRVIACVPADKLLVKNCELF